MERKLLFDKNSWESLYQQNPQIVGGEIIRGSWFGSYSKLPILKQRIIYADTAQKTSERNDYSVFECWGLGSDGKLYLIDMIRGKWEAPELKRRAVAFWNKHAAYKTNNFGQLRQMKVEDKASGTGLIQDLKLTERLPIIGIQRTKDKYTRLLDVIGYIEAGYVMLPIDGTFTNDFIYECESFTSDDSHKHDDQVDPMIDAINDLLASDNIVTMWENMI
jgi:predicted phage terminase large subunit-like protein